MAGGDLLQNLPLAVQPVGLVGGDEGRRVGDRRTVAGEENVTTLRGALGMSKERLHAVDCLILPVGLL